MRTHVLGIALLVAGLCSVPAWRVLVARSSPAGGSPTFYRDVLPIVQNHCQSCHRVEGIAPAPFVTYAETRPWARAIEQAVESKAMPPWFADPRYGRFADDPSLTPQEIATLASWAESGAPEGDPHDAPPSHRWTGGWSIPQPDLVLKMPAPVKLPAHGDVEYTY